MQLLQGGQRVHGEAAAKDYCNVEAGAGGNVRDGQGRAHSDVLKRVEFRNDNLGALREQQQATVACSNQQLLAPRVQTLRAQHGITHQNEGVLKQK